MSENSDLRPPLRLCLAASASLRVFPSTLLDFMESLDPRTVVLLRRGNKTDPGLFEQMISRAAMEHWWFGVEWWQPDPALGREGTYIRDVEMTKSAHLVLAFFDGIVLEGGTGHVVEKAMDREVPVYAFGLHQGMWERIGELDVDHVWSDRIRNSIRI